MTKTGLACALVLLLSGCNSKDSKFPTLSNPKAPAFTKGPGKGPTPVPDKPAPLGPDPLQLPSNNRLLLVDVGSTLQLTVKFPPIGPSEIYFQDGFEVAGLGAIDLTKGYCK